jgi:hypothetical protein
VPDVWRPDFSHPVILNARGFKVQGKSMRKCWGAALIVNLVCLSYQSSARVLRLAVIPELIDSTSAATQSGKHDLLAYSREIEQRGHSVTIMKELPAEEDFFRILTEDHTGPKQFDAIISQGDITS